MENKYKFNVYPLSEIDGGGFYAEVPELPGCIASAATLEETIKYQKDNLGNYYKTLIMLVFLNLKILSMKGNTLLSFLKNYLIKHNYHSEKIINLFIEITMILCLLA